VGVGVQVGENVGRLVGAFVGVFVGILVGTFVGSEVGPLVGLAVGSLVVLGVGTPSQTSSSHTSLKVLSDTTLLRSESPGSQSVHFDPQLLA